VILPLRSRLTLLHTGVFSVLLIALAAISYRVLAYQLDADVSANLAELTAGLHGYLRFQEGTPTVVFDPADPAETAFVQEATRYYQVFDAITGDLVVQSDALRPLGLEFTPGEVHRFVEQAFMFDIQTDYGRIRLSNSVLEPTAGRRYLLQVGVTLRPMDRALGRFLALLAIGVPAGLVALFVIGRWTAGVALNPLTHLAAATRSIDIEGLRRRRPVRGARDEVDDVAVAFNDTLARLDRAISEMRQFSAALAHELRTPLAALRGDIELAMLKSSAAEDVQRLGGQLEEIDRLKGLIDRVLLLARAEGGEIPLALGPVNLGPLAASLVEQLEPIAQAKGVTLQCEQADSALVEGDAEWLKRVVLNLLDNAIKFTPAGGRIVVAVSSASTEGRLTVRDTGVGIDPSVAPHIFEPFFRADPARSSNVEGAGLGLSLVKWVVDRHRGRIELESRPGQGSTFTVSLPLARS
jgi:heavy metal sensor kinase